MHDSDNTGPTSAREKENPAVPVMLYLAIVVGTITAALLSGGLAMMGATAYKIGPYAGYGAGLMMAGVAITLTVAIGALLCHRINLRDNARTRALVHQLRADVARWNIETNNRLGVLRGEVSAAHEENTRAHQAILRIEKDNAETLTDQLTPRRNSS